MTDKIDLAAATIDIASETMQAILANALDLKLSIKQAHWTAYGPNFIALHTFFESMEEQLSDTIDDLAERLMALERAPRGTLAAIASETALPPFPLGERPVSEHIATLLQSHRLLAKRVRAAIEQCAEAGDQGSADLLTGFSRELDKTCWLLRAHRAEARQ